MPAQPLTGVQAAAATLAAVIDTSGVVVTDLTQRKAAGQRCARRIRKGQAPMRRRAVRAAAGCREAGARAGPREGFPLSASKVHQVHAILPGALQQAVRWGWIAHNPARLATPPS